MPYVYPIPLQDDPGPYITAHHYANHESSHGQPTVENPNMNPSAPNNSPTQLYQHISLQFHNLQRMLADLYTPTHRQGAHARQVGHLLLTVIHTAD